MKKILILFVLIVLSKFNIYSQPKDSISLLWEKVSIQTDSLMRLSKSDFVFHNDISRQIEWINKNSENLQGQINTVLSMSNQASTDIANLLAIFGIGITLVISIVSIILGVFIARKEKSMTELLTRSDENLQQQKSIETKTEDLKVLIENQLTSLYKKLKVEEYNDIVQKIEQDPSQMKAHLSRLLTLDLHEGEFDRFISNLISWNKIEEQDNSDNVDYLVIYLLNRHPIRMAANHKVSAILCDSWARMFYTVDFDKVIKFIDEYLKAFFEEKYVGIDKEIAFILNTLCKRYNGQYIAKEMLFDKYSTKDERFKIYQMIQENKAFDIFLFYKPLMLETYSGQQNTPAEEKLLSFQNTPENK